MNAASAAGRRTFRNLAVTVGAGQALAIHLSYLLAARMEHVPWCMPYWENCSSISAAGRHMPEALLFKVTMFPLAVLVILYWRTAREVLDSTAAAGRGSAGMVRLGTAAAVLLIVYTALLGIGGDVQRQLRHAAVILSFALTYLAQLQITRAALAAGAGLYSRPARWFLLVLSLAALAVGIGNVLAQAWYPGFHRVDNAIEWNLALLLNAYFLVTALVRCEPAQREPSE